MNQEEQVIKIRQLEEAVDILIQVVIGVLNPKERKKLLSVKIVKDKEWRKHAQKEE